MSESSPAIQITDLRKVYGTKAAVDGLSLSVPRGSFYGFLGPNGAGKTTTIKMLMGLAVPNSGSIEILASITYRKAAHRIHAYGGAVLIAVGGAIDENVELTCGG